MEYHNRSGCLTPSRSENDPRIRKLKGFSPFTLPKKKEGYQRSKGSSPINGLAPKNHDNRNGDFTGDFFLAGRA